MEKYELQKLRDLPIEGVAERLGLQVTRHKCLCPFHEDHHPSLSFSQRRNTYRCFVCGATGGTIDLVMNLLHKDFLDACRWLAGEAHPFPLPMGGGQSLQGGSGISYSNCNTNNKTPLPLEGVGGRPFDASRYERFFEHPFLNEPARRFLFDERRIDPRVVRWCRLTSWTDRNGTPWLQIPYYNKEGKLVGIQNRNLMTPPSLPKGGDSPQPSAINPQPSAINPQPSTINPQPSPAPRFRFPQGSECGIYNLPVLNRLKPGDELYIAEGCSDCWTLLSAGHKAIAIPSATLLKKKDVELLSTLNVQAGIKASPLRGRLEGAFSFHMYPDRDEPGERLFLQLQKFLPHLVHHQLPPDCKDFSEYFLKPHLLPSQTSPFAR